MEALDAGAGAADAAPRSWSGVFGGDGTVALVGVAVVRFLDVGGVELAFGAVDAAVGFEAADAISGRRGEEPVAGRDERLAFTDGR
jgi:hypothetical protein